MAKGTVVGNQVPVVVGARSSLLGSPMKDLLGGPTIRDKRVEVILLSRLNKVHLEESPSRHLNRELRAPSFMGDLSFSIPPYRWNHVIKKKIQAAHKPKAELVCLCLLFVILRSKHQNCLCWFSNSSSAEAHAIRTL